MTYCPIYKTITSSMTQNKMPIVSNVFVFWNTWENTDIGLLHRFLSAHVDCPSFSMSFLTKTSTDSIEFASPKCSFEFSFEFFSAIFLETTGKGPKSECWSYIYSLKFPRTKAHLLNRPYDVLKISSWEFQNSVRGMRSKFWKEKLILSLQKSW